MPLLNSSFPLSKNPSSLTFSLYLSSKKDVSPLKKIKVLAIATMITECLTCGNEGVRDALVYCNKCQVYVQYRYCLDMPAVIIVGSVTWYCENCEMEVVEPSTSEKGSPVPSKKCDSLHLTKVKTNQDKVDLKEAIKIAIEAKKLKKDTTASVKKTNVHLSVGGTGLQLDETPCIEHPSALKGVIHCEVSESTTIPHVAINHTSRIAAFNFYPDAQPIVDPIWRGSFCFFHGNFGPVRGVAAHPSHLASYKVHEEAKLFPDVLYVDFFHSSIVWEKCFKKWGPTDRAIGLYFFPENDDSAKSIFYKLVYKMIHLDLVIRAAVKNAELIVFPSNKLPVYYRSELLLFSKDLGASFICGDRSERRAFQKWKKMSPVRTKLAQCHHHGRGRVQLVL